MSVQITEVAAKRGRRWVYGPLDPARPIEIKPMRTSRLELEAWTLRDAMFATGESDPYRAYHRMNGGHIYGD